MKTSVLFIARKFPPSVGGMERFAYDLSNELSRQTRLRRIVWGGSNKMLPLILPLFFLRACLVLSRHNTDIIHIQDGVQAPLGWLLSRIFRLPYIVVAHGLDVTYEKYAYQKLIVPFIVRADHVITISTATMTQVIDRGGEKERVSMIPLGIHDDFGSAHIQDKIRLGKLLKISLSDRPILLTTGRLVRRKGVSWFIENPLRDIVSLVPGVLYLVAGTGTAAEQNRVRQAIISSGLKDNVRLLGRVSDETRNELYQSSDIFVMPNISVPGDMEGFGIVAQEAATAGLPVVASGIEGVLDALDDEKSGLLMHEQDSDEFSRTIVRLLNDDAYRRMFGDNARKYTLEHYEWASIAAQYEDIYKTLAS